MRKKIAVLGSTGSVGRQALAVAEFLGLEVVGLVAGSNSALLAEQIEKYRPSWAVLTHGSPFTAPAATQLAYGSEAVAEYSSNHGADIVVAAISGVAGLVPTWRAVSTGVTVALANKESLVTAGTLIMQAAAESGAKIIPIDSEHAAIWQCLQGVKATEISRLILTASGGPFRAWPRDQLEKVTIEDALAHPTWSMGKKITIDSATLMNKGLEVIEAHWLFGVDYEKIEVVIHPESIVHSCVELVDGSILAQLAHPDMRMPIQQALTYPERQYAPWPRLSLAEIGSLTFSQPRYHDFPCLKLAVEAGRAGGSYPVVLNAANEVAVQAFLAGEISFVAIAKLVAATLDQHRQQAVSDIQAVMQVDQEARRLARRLKGKIAS